MVRHAASFGSNPQALSYSLAGKKGLAKYIICIYYIRSDRPGLFNDPANSFSEVCGRAMVNENKTCVELWFHHALTQHSEDFLLFLQAGRVEDSCFGIEY